MHSALSNNNPESCRVAQQLKKNRTRRITINYLRQKKNDSKWTVARKPRDYMRKVKAVGMTMRMYERYIDDSNQVAKVPINGSKYDEDSELVVFDEQEVRDDEMEDERLAVLLRDIANYVQKGKEM